MVRRLYYFKNQKDKQRRRDAGEEVSSKYFVILDGVSTLCLTTKDDEEPWITYLQREDKDLILLWLPPNTTGDLQSLDVNFNRPFKAKYREELYNIELLSGQEDDPDMHDLDEYNDVEEEVITVEDGTEFHLDVKGNTGGTRSQPKVTREFERASKVKSRVIEALITSNKSINKELITTAWKVSGKAVIGEFYKGTFQNNVQRWRGYNQAWDEQVQNVAEKAQEDESKLFFKHMSGGISDIELGLQFIPRPGRKKRQQHSQEEDVDMEEGQTTECSGEISEYGSKDCPDDDEEEREYGFSTDEDEELVEGFDELALNEETGQTSP